MLLFYYEGGDKDRVLLRYVSVLWSVALLMCCLLLKVLLLPLAAVNTVIDREFQNSKREVRVSGFDLTPESTRD